MSGLISVFMDTSQLILYFYSYPKFVYKELFNRGYMEYLKEFFKYFISFLLCTSVSYLIASNIVLDNNYLEIIKNMVVALIVPNTILLVLYCRTDEFKYFKELFNKITKKILRIA